MCVILHYISSKNWQFEHVPGIRSIHGVSYRIEFKIIISYLERKSCFFPVPLPFGGGVIMWL